MKRHAIKDDRESKKKEGMWRVERTDDRGALIGS